MKTSETIKSISTALVEAQKEMGDAKKDSKNPFFKSTYADLNAIREVAIPALNKHNMVVLQPIISDVNDSYVETIIMHESGEWISCQTRIVLAKDSDPQAYGSGISYARRYGLQSLLNIGAVDDDGEAAMMRAQAKPTQTQTQTTAPATNSFIAKGANKTTPTTQWK